MMNDETREKMEAALANNTEMLRWCPDDELVWMQKGMIHMEAKQFDEAVAAFSRAIIRWPYSAEPFNLRGHCMINMGNYAFAAADYQEAYRLNPDKWEIMYHYALALFLTGEYERAEMISRRTVAAAEGAGNLAAASAWLWHILMHVQKEEEAQAAIDAVLDDMEMEEEDLGYYQTIFVIKGKLDPEPVRKGLRADDLQSITAAYGISGYYRFVKKDTAKADEICRALMEAAKEEWSACFAYQAASVDLGFYALPYATPEWDEKLKKDPENELYWHLKNHVYADKQEKPTAVQATSLAILHVKDPARFYQRRGHWSINLGYHERAAADLTLACLMRPEDKNVLYHTALTSYLIGEYKRAERIYKRALELSNSATEDISTTNWLWATLMHEGKEAEAAALLETVPEEVTVGSEAFTGGYYRMLMLYKGKLDPDTFLPEGELTSEGVTTAYGLANYYYYVAKDVKKADEILDRILKGTKGTNRYPFGYQAASTERKRRG